MEEEEIQSSEENEDMFIEDEYESVNEKILSEIEKNENKEMYASLQQKTQNKISKLKLLLYQKFLNILYTIITLHMKTYFKHFNKATIPKVLNAKGYVTNNKKYKLPSFYVKTMLKQQERNEKKALIKKQ
jgi:hypothetical protein